VSERDNKELNLFFASLPLKYAICLLPKILSTFQQSCSASWLQQPAKILQVTLPQRLRLVAGRLLINRLSGTVGWARQTVFNSRPDHTQDLKNRTCGLSSLMLGVRWVGLREKFTRSAAIDSPQIQHTSRK